MYGIIHKTFEISNCVTFASFQRWKDSGFDTKVAETMLEEAFEARLKKQQHFDARRLQGQLIQMIEGAVSLSELRKIVEVTGPYMGTQALVQAMQKTSRLPAVRRIHGLP
jgi:ribosomal protein S2